jgi:hypothetical protein
VTGSSRADAYDQRTVSSPRRSPALGGVLLAAVIVGCGGDDNLMTANYARAIEQSVLQQHDQVVKAECPPEVPKEKGHTFTCTVHLDVGSYPVTVTEVDDDGSVKYGNPQPAVLLDVKNVERAIAEEIHKQRDLDSQVTCPKVVLQKAGLTFECKAAVEGGTETRFRVEQTDDAGNVSFTGL